MFGFIVVNGNALNEEQKLRYRGCYCGLCRALKQRHGNLSRLTLNYDMTFLILLLTAMYEPEESEKDMRCLVHPAHRRQYWQNRFTDYAADLNVALAYHNCLDDYRDEKRMLSLAEARMLKSHYSAVASLLPEQCAAIERCMEELHGIESSGSTEPDAAANCFGRLMGSIFMYGSDALWGERLRQFGEALGRFIYMMDACVDLEKDRKKGNYNPLAFLEHPPTEEEKISMLKMLIGECAGEFEKLPIIQDADILRNILYSGVWSQYAAAMKKKRKGDHGSNDQRSV